MTAWYAVQAKRHNEARVDLHLRSRGYDTFLPLIEIVRLYQTRRAVMLEPLFPSYLFVRMADPTVRPADWYTVRWTPGVRNVLATDDRPTPIPVEVIEAIQDRVRGLGFVRPRSGFRQGTKVRIRRGPLEGLEAVLDRPMSREGRVRVLLNLLGQPRIVELDLVDLESA